MRLTGDGKTLTAIREVIDEKYLRFGPATPTLRPN